MEYLYFNYYKCNYVVCEKKKNSRCVNSVSGLYLHPLRYVINVVCFFFLRDLCFKSPGRTYTLYDVYGN